MSEAISSVDASEQESVLVYGMKGEMSITNLTISSRSMTSLDLSVAGTICPGFEIGWVSQVTMRLYHSYILVGETTFPHKAIIPNSDDVVEINWEEIKESEMHIKNMMGWKYFFEGFMPKVGASHEPNKEESPTAGLGVSPSGHQLIISIDLAKMMRMTVVVKRLILSGDVLKIVININNQSPLMLDFDGDCNFVLEQEGEDIGYMKGKLEIADNRATFVFRGRYNGRASGMATLKGDRFYSSDKKDSWLQYALRLFEVEIDLDEIVINNEFESDLD
ncbi:hypothetical protein GGI35DRAFT_476630 [Trichoderma velutinum]